MKMAIVYATMSGNTEELAEAIADHSEGKGFTCTFIRAGDLPVSFREYDLVLFGTYTWGNGELPAAMRKTLRHVLIDNDTGITKAAVFGTGDETFPKYCRAVDEIEYHLSKNGVNVIAEGLKIEQSCRGSQMTKVNEWIGNITKGEFENGTTKNQTT